jgi:hypothetical protein
MAMAIRDSVTVSISDDGQHVWMGEGPRGTFTGKPVRTRINTMDFERSTRKVTRKAGVREPQTRRLKAGGGRLKGPNQDLFWEKARSVPNTGIFLLLNGQMAQEPTHLCSTHFSGMPFAVEEDKAPDPFTVSLLGANRIMLEGDDLADLVQEFEFGIGNEAVQRRVRLCFFNIKPHFRYKSLSTTGLTSFIFVPVRLIRRLI